MGIFWKCFRCGAGFLIIFLSMIFSKQMVCFGAPADPSKAVDKKMDDVWALFATADLGHAEERLEALKQEYPDNLLIQVGFGYLFLEKGESKRAEVELGKVIRLGEGDGDIATKPDSIRHAVSLAYSGGGRIFMQKLDMLNALAYFTKAYYAFSMVSAYIQCAVIERKYQHNYKLCEQIHQEIQTAYPDDFPSNRIQLAILYLIEGKKVEADKLIVGLPKTGYFFFDWAAFYSVAGDIEKTMDFLKSYLDRYRPYPARCRQILRDVQNDSDFKNLRRAPQFNEWLKKVTAAYVKSVSSPVGNKV